jgi:hypothetical protein
VIVSPTDPSPSSPVERMIEDGLERYARGDLDGALASWEGALALAPDEPRALGYVDYVRGHAELLRGGGGAAADSELAVPFGLASLGDDDGYDIEVTRTSERARVEQYLDAIDDGWFIDDGAALPTVARPLPLPATDEPRSAPAIMLELEADEPPLVLDGLDFGPTGAMTRSTFDDDDQTRDFGTAARLASPVPLTQLEPLLAIGDLDLDAPSLAETTQMPRIVLAAPVAAAPPAAALPPAPLDPGAGDFDFDTTADETAELKDRHLGFVRRAAEPGRGQREPGPGSWAAPEPATADLKVRFRPQLLSHVPPPSLEPAAATPDPAADLDLPAAPGLLDLDPPRSSPDDDDRTIERNAWTRARPTTPSTSSLELDLDLGGSPSIAPPLIVDELTPEPPLPPRRGAPTRELPAGPRRGEPITKPPLTKPRMSAIPPIGTAVPVPTRIVGPAVGPTGHPLLADSDRGAPPDETPDDRVRRRITALIDRATAATRDGRHRDAAIDLALTVEPDSAVAQKLVHRSRDQFVGAYLGFLGDLQARPVLAVPMHEVARQPLDTRAAFLLSRVDGTLTLDELLDVSGMPRLEALRHLSHLVGLGVLAVG